ncbi:tetratricopeptide repeat protein [Carboxylicivirga sediminis]|uniref:Tetratricopeptide repeat protein n=1 Tax=Carboxylicivirga sediminis TaxID=2006564 RepID=A0A941F3V5_9BACT|nr:tetratricopeptide repeat protein [Carboxylicivirga sediminis]MBR8535942.1 tetratricopeptide repeat protein [Carboxylicivirga sediminis]
MKGIWAIISFLFLCLSVYGQSLQQELNHASKLQETNPDSCILISYEIFTQLSDEQRIEKAHALWNLAQAYLYKHKYHSALLYAFKGEELFAEKDTAILHQRIQATTGWIFYDIGNYKQAEPYHQKALDIAQLRNDLSSEIVYTNALGLNALNLNQYQKALGLFQKALFLLSRMDPLNKSLLATVQNNMGVVYVRYEDWGKAEESLLQAIENSSGHASALIETYSQLGKVYLSTHQYEKCKSYLDAAEELSYLTSYSFSLIEYYQIRYEYEFIAGNLNAAYRYQNKYIQLYKKINNNDAQEVMNYLMSVQDEKIKQDELLIKQAREIAFNRQVLIIVGIISTLVIIIVLYLMFRSKAEKAFLKQQLLSQELEKKEQQQAELSHKLAYKDEAIETLALTISQRNDLVKSVAEDVNKSSSDELKAAWKKFQLEFDQYTESSMLSEEYIKEFKYRLKTKFPSLTDKDMQLIIDIRKDLTSKELADKYHVEVKSIEMSRYRLRKKLQLEKGIQLKDFIMKI